MPEARHGKAQASPGEGDDLTNGDLQKDEEHDADEQLLPELLDGGERYKASGEPEQQARNERNEEEVASHVVGEEQSNKAERLPPREDAVSLSNAKSQGNVVDQDIDATAWVGGHVQLKEVSQEHAQRQDREEGTGHSADEPEESDIGLHVSRRDLVGRSSLEPAQRFLEREASVEDGEVV